MEPPAAVIVQPESRVKKIDKIQNILMDDIRKMKDQPSDSQ